MKTKRLILTFLLFVLTISLSSCTFINGFKISSSDVDYEQKYDNFYIKFSGSQKSELKEGSYAKIKIRITTSDNEKLTYEFTAELEGINGKKFKVDEIIGLKSIFKANGMDYHKDEITDVKILDCKMVDNCSNYGAYIFIGVPICISVIILFIVSFINFDDENKKKLNNEVNS